MRSIAALLVVGCATGPHADVFVKRDFGFIGPREITVVGLSSDANMLRLKLQKLGFRVLEKDRLDDATTRYAADIAGFCQWQFVTDYAPDVQLHVFVVKVETRERLLSARLASRDDCPESFFVEAAAAIARNWPIEESATR